jgi:hypothetical protein
MKGRELVAPSEDGQELQVADDLVLAWEQHVDRRTGDYISSTREQVLVSGIRLR